MTEPSRNDREAAALSYAKEGLRVLPLKPRDKQPHGLLVPHGFKDATCDEATIREWFTQEPDINIGIATGDGLVVLDADSVEAEAMIRDLTPTRTAKTGKGTHLYYRCEGPIQSNVGELGEKLDVRGDRGYVVAPPSVHPNGSVYRWEGDSPMADLPTDIAERLRRPTLPTASATSGTIPEGQRNSALATLAGRSIRRSPTLGPDEFKAIVRDLNQSRCQPPLPDSEVTALAERIYQSASTKRVEPPRTGRLLSRDEIDNLPDPEFLVDELLVKDSIAILYGEPGAAKSFLAVDLAIAVATNAAWAHHQVKGGSVVYVSAEGVRGLKRRIRANEFTKKTRAKNLHMVDEAVQLHHPQSVDRFLEQLATADLAPKLIIFDTLARCAVGLDENSAKDMGQVVAGLDRIRREFEATILIVHHSQKKQANVIRGSSALLGACDTALSLTRQNEERILNVEKQKDAAPRDTLTFRLVPAYDSAILKLVDPGAEPHISHLSDKHQKVLDTLKEMGSATSTDWMKKTGLTKSSFQRIRPELCDQKLVVQEGGLYRATQTVPIPLIERLRKVS